MIKKSVFALVLLGLLIAVYSVLRGGRLHGPFVMTAAALPMVAAKLAGISLTRILPDTTLGFLDAGLLTVVAALGAAGFGVAGAVVAAVIADSLIDSFIERLEGLVKVMFYGQRFDAEHSRMERSYGKMIGCFLGTGVVLTIAGAMGVSPWKLMR